MLKKYERFCELVNKMRLADKQFKKEQDRFYDEIGGDGKARNTAYCKLRDKEFDVEHFMQKALGIPDFHTQILKDYNMVQESVKSASYKNFYKLVKSLEKTEKKYWETALAYNNKRITQSETIKPTQEYSVAELNLETFLNNVIYHFYEKRIELAMLKQ